MQTVLIYTYVALGFAAFWFGIAGILAGFRMLRGRSSGVPLWRALCIGPFNELLFTDQGKQQRRRLLGSTLRLLLSLAGMAAVVAIGIQTSS